MHEQHSTSKAHAMGSCGASVGAILLKELLGHGLATHNEGGAVLGTLYTLLENHTSGACKRDQTLLYQVKH